MTQIKINRYGKVIVSKHLALPKELCSDLIKESKEQEMTLNTYIIDILEKRLILKS